MKRFESCVANAAAVLWTIGWMSAAGVWAGEPDVSSENTLHAEATALVRQLGDEHFAKRERATAELIRIGLPAKEALEEGRKLSDREIRFRCQRILVIVDELDFQRRLDEFASSDNNDQDFGLPGWKKYRERLGADQQARNLFVEMQKEEPDAMQALDEGPKAISDYLDVRTVQLQQSMSVFRTQLTVGNVAALLLLASDDGVNVSQQAGGTLYSFCYQASFREAIQGGPKKDLMRSLLGTWVQRGEGWTAYQGMMLSMQYDLKEGLEPAVKALKEGPNQTHIRQYAILTIAKFGGESHMPLLEEMLEDATATSTQRINNKSYQTQVRDVALAALVKLTGQDFKKFGFDRLQTHQQIVFNPSTLGFENDEARNKSLEAWKNFRSMKNKPEE